MSNKGNKEAIPTSEGALYLPRIFLGPFFEGLPLLLPSLESFYSFTLLRLILLGFFFLQIPLSKPGQKFSRFGISARGKA